jgi:predicted DCC family thiol-disulfide oxidoreductase YuxK
LGGLGMKSSSLDNRSDRLSIIYDGQCPFCTNFVKLYAIRKKVAEVELTDARGQPGLVRELRARGMDVNDGMVVIWQGRYYFGAAGMHLLSVLGTKPGIFGVFNRLLFRNRHVAGMVYPALATGRRITLSLLRRKLIG